MEDYTVEIGLSGVGFDETLIHYVRRCATRSEADLSRRLRWKVDIARRSIAEGARRDELTVAVTARTHCGREHQAESADLDGMLAIRNAFALVADRVSRAPRLESVRPPAA